MQKPRDLAEIVAERALVELGFNFTTEELKEKYLAALVSYVDRPKNTDG